jgi:hypothetical protein
MFPQHSRLSARAGFAVLVWGGWPRALAIPHFMAHAATMHTTELGCAVTIARYLDPVGMLICEQPEMDEGGA